MKKKISVLQIIRHLIQLICFLIFPGFFVTVYAALKTVCSGLIHGSFSIYEMWSDVTVLVAVIPVTILLGRFFCGFICSFGAMGDLLYFLSGRIMKKRPHITERVDRVMKYIKYVIFAGLVIFVWVLGLALPESFNPWYVFGIYSSVAGFTSVVPLLGVGGILLILIVVAGFFFERFFCRYLCPLGAFFALISRFRLFRIKKKPEKCVGCGLCNKKCSMGIELASADKIVSGECIDCMHCTRACHLGALEANGKETVAGLAATTAIMGLYYVGSITVAVPDETPIPSPPPISEVGESETVGGLFADGVYHGMADGFRGTIDVEVTVSNGYISDITVVSYKDDASYMRKAKSTIISRIIAAQSADVATVSGATMSSRGIINAVSDALGEGMIYSADDFFEEDDFVEESTTLTPDSTTDRPGSSTDIPSVDTTAAVPQVFVDGVYSGTGKGYRGDTTVTVTVEGGRITDITVEDFVDDSKYFTRAQSGIISAILSSQSTGVSTVTGATYSSNGIIAAVSDALGIEFENPNNSITSGGHGRH